VGVEVSCRIVDGRDVIEVSETGEVTPRVQRGSSRRSRSEERRMRPDAEVPPQPRPEPRGSTNRILKTAGERAGDSERKRRAQCATVVPLT
jgi:hypothetical protein